MADPSPKREACHGSCHCGFTRYIIFLTLPHPLSASRPPQDTDQEIYRCNCSTCHKLSFLHVHPAHPHDDFMLLSPLDPDRELRTYQCQQQKRKFYFCPTCGVRCLTFSGAAEREVVQLPDGGGETEVWRAQWDGKPDSRPYVSVNGTTIDGREGFDLRVLTEEQRIMYLDGRSDPEVEKEARWDRPHDGGCY